MISNCQHTSQTVFSGNTMTLGYAKYHGHAYRIHVDPDSPTAKPPLVSYVPAMGEGVRPLSLEQRCGLELVRVISDEAHKALSSTSADSPQRQLQAALAGLTTQAEQQRVYWIEKPENYAKYWSVLPRLVVQEILSYLNKHEALQLRAVCYAWKQQEPRLWQLWHNTHTRIFPRHAAWSCGSFVDFRRCQEGYLQGFYRLENAPAKGDSSARIGKGLWITDTHILRTHTISGKKPWQQQLCIQRRDTGKQVLKQALTNEVRVYHDATGGHTSWSTPGWFVLDDLVAGHDLKSGALRVYDIESGMVVLSIDLPKQTVDAVYRETADTLTTVSVTGLIQRWSLATGELEHTHDLTEEIDGCHHVQRCGDALLFSSGRKGVLVDLSFTPRVLGTFAGAGSLQRWGEAYIVRSYDGFGLYRKTVMGSLELVWQRKLQSIHTVGNVLIGETMGMHEFQVLDPETGEAVRHLFKGKYNTSHDVFIEDGLLFVATLPYGEALRVAVIDIASGEVLMSFKLNSRATVMGVQGDTLFVDVQGKVCTLEPAIPLAQSGEDGG